MTKLLSLLLTAILINSCTSPANKLSKAYNADPVAVAKFCRDKFPCNDIAIDTVIKTEYDFIEVKCPNDTITNTDTLYIPIKYKPQSFIIKKTRFIASPVITKTITKIIRDSSCEILLNKSVENQQKYVRKNEKQADWIKWLLILLFASILLNLLFITNKR